MERQTRGEEWTESATCLLKNMLDHQANEQDCEEGAHSSRRYLSWANSKDVERRTKASEVPNKLCITL